MPFVQALVEGQHGLLLLLRQCPGLACERVELGVLALRMQFLHVRQRGFKVGLAQLRQGGNTQCLGVPGVDLEPDLGDLALGVGGVQCLRDLHGPPDHRGVPGVGGGLGVVHQGDVVTAALGGELRTQQGEENIGRKVPILDLLRVDDCGFHGFCRVPGLVILGFRFIRRGLVGGGVVIAPRVRGEAGAAAEQKGQGKGGGKEPRVFLHLESTALKGFQ